MNRFLILALLVVFSLVLAQCASVKVVSQRYTYITNKHTGEPVAKHTFWLDVRNGRGDFVHEFDRKNVKVFQDGFDLGGEATKGFKKVSEATIHLALDVSGSIVDAGALPDLLDSVHGFLNATGARMPNSKYVLYLFSSEYSALAAGKDGSLRLAEGCLDATVFDASAFTSRESLDNILKKRVHESNENSKYTNLYGAISAQAECASLLLEKKRVSGPAVIVVFTDGKDNIGEATADGIEYRKNSIPPIISVGLGNVNQADLRKISQRGMFFYAKEVAELRDAFGRLASNIAFLWQFDFFPPKGKEEIPVELELKVSALQRVVAKLSYEWTALDSIVARKQCIALLQSAPRCNSSLLEYAAVHACMRQAVSGGGVEMANDCIECAWEEVKNLATPPTTLDWAPIRNCINQKELLR